MKSLSNIIFIRHKLLGAIMQKDNDLLDYVNKVKTLVDQFVWLKVFVRDENIVILEVCRHYTYIWSSLWR